MAARPDEDARVRAYYDRVAAGYDRQMGFGERRFLGEHRAWAVGRTTGRVLEIGVGSGLNLPHYPAGADVVGIDLSPRMVELAQRRLDRGVTTAVVRLRVGDAQQLDLPDASVDTVLATYALCTIPDPAAALAEAHRVLRPGGRAVVVEHGPGSNALVRVGQRLLDPVAVRFAADHLLRDPVPYLVAAGFVVDSADRAGLGKIVHRVVAHAERA